MSLYEEKQTKKRWEPQAFPLRVVRYAFQRRHDILVSILLNRLRCLSTALDLNPSRKMKTDLSFKLAG